MKVMIITMKATVKKLSVVEKENNSNASN